MRRYLLVFTILLFSTYTKAQSVFSFHCSRDTTVPCNINTLTLNAKTLEIKEFGPGATYTINPMTGSSPGQCFAPYVNPGAPGNPTNLTIDDRYSSVINLGFAFPFLVQRSIR
ncbi:MAG: hypothetical protein IPP48_13880 [Chitinophagaceae bacterium]|nr:hypothetical protein [Chitinophagaceae bacterium]